MSQTEIFTTKKDKDIIEFMSEIKDDKTYNFTGKNLRKLLINFHLGNYVNICLELISTVQDINNNKSIKAVELMDKNISDKKINESLRETISQQSYRLEKARELRKEPIELPQIDEDVAKYLFDEEIEK